MILRRVRVEGFRCFRAPVDLEGLGLGVNLIYAPNETGKSSLILAVARALFDRYGTQSEEMQASRPWGTQLSPKVQLELETRGKRFRLEKSFLDGAMSRLLEWTGERFEPLAEANAADELTRGFLQGTGSSRGASDLEHWGLARILWMPQASRLAPPKVEGALRERLLEVLGAASLSEREQGILEKIEEAFSVFYTPKNEQPRKSGPLGEAEREFHEAESQVKQWRERCEQANLHAATAASAETRSQAARTRRQSMESEIARLETQARQELETEAALQEKRQELNTITERWKHLQSTVSDLTRLKDGIARHRQAATTADAALGASTAAVAACRQTLDATLLEQKAAGEKVGELTARATTATLHAQVRQQREQIAKAEEIRKEGEAKRRELDSVRRASESDLTELKRIQSELERARARMEALGLEVVFEAETARSLTWTSGGERREHQASPGEPVTLRAIDAGVLELPGVGRIRLRSGAEDARKSASAVAAGEARLSAKLKELGVGSVEEAAQRREAGARLEAEIVVQRRLFSAALGERFRNLDEAKRVLGEAEAQLRELTVKVGHSSADLADADPAALTAEARQARAAEENLGRKRQQEELALRAAEKELASLTARKDSEARSADTLQAEWDAKASTHGALEILQAQAGEEALRRAMGEAQVKALETKLPAPGQRAPARLECLKRDLQTCHAEEREADAQFYTARSVLEQAAGHGVYSRLTEAEERLALAERVLSARKLEASAARCLRQIARERESQLDSRFVHPIQEKVGAYFSRIRGRETLVKMGAELDEVSLSGADGAGGSLALHSFGTQEQTMFAVRMALGHLLAEHGPGAEPPLIVLDDPLVNTDAARRERALELIREAGERMQILILTAFPEKYRALAAREFDLSALRYGNA